MFDWDEILFFGSIFGVIVIVGALLTGAVNYGDYIDEEAQIEQLRTDVNKSDGIVSEDIAGQVTAKNQLIASWRRWNDVPIIQIIIPNGWDRIDFIEAELR